MVVGSVRFGWVGLGSKKCKVKCNAMQCLGGGELAVQPVMAHRTNLGTEAEPQQIVAQRLLSCLQYPVP